MTRLQKTMEKREKILAYIIDFKQKNDGLSPTVRDITKNCEFSSTSVTDYHLDKMVVDGKIKRQRRGIMIPGGSWTPPEQLL